MMIASVVDVALPLTQLYCQPSKTQFVVGYTISSQRNIINNIYLIMCSILIELACKFSHNTLSLFLKLLCREVGWLKINGNRINFDSKRLAYHNGRRTIMIEPTMLFHIALYTFLCMKRKRLIKVLI
jgi:hypothetical protein